MKRLPHVAILLVAVALIAADKGEKNDGKSVAATATRLTQLHQAKKWPEVQRLLDELFSGDRTFAAQVISISLRNPAIKTRTHLIDDVRRADLKEIVPTLGSLLDDSEVRTSSAIALGDLGDRRAISPLERCLERESDLLARYRIRVSLAKLGRPYLKYFTSGITDRDSYRRYLCIGALGNLKDKRAVPYLLKIVEESTETRDPVHASRSITKITGVESFVVIKTIKRADGGVSTTEKRRPRKEFKADCLAWIARHRNEVTRPIEKPSEPWKYTPEPLLPGLNVAFSMNARQVMDVYRDAKLEYRHKPEKRWEKGGNKFSRSENIKAAKTCQNSLNQGLLSTHYLFEHNRLDRIYIERVGQGDSVVKPLIGPLKLRKINHSSWSGLDGSIIVEFLLGNAEKETYVIRLKRSTEAAN